MPAPARHQHKITRPAKNRQQKTAPRFMVWLGFGGAAVAMLVIALIFKDSSIDLALIALLGVPICTLLQQADLTDSFAQYAFLLLCIGTISALIEQWKKK